MRTAGIGAGCRAIEGVSDFYSDYLFSGACEILRIARVDKLWQNSVRAYGLRNEQYLRLKILELSLLNTNLHWHFQRP